MPMQDRDETTVDRRGFLQAGAAAGALAIGAGGTALGADDPVAEKALPRRKLGRTGVEVTILNQGTWQAPGFLDRILRLGYASGIRYVDTARGYGSEPGIAKWMQSDAAIRKSIFLVTKEDRVKEPRQLIKFLDERLEKLQTDHVDLIFIHALGDHHTLEEAVEIAGGKEFKETAEAIRKSGKAKFVGFSTHHKNRDKILAAAAKGGFVDAIMVQNSAWLPKDTDLNRSLDAVHKAGIGLISMKQIAGSNPASFLKEVPKHAPELVAKGLSPFGALLHSIWSDERFTTCCVSMRTTDQLRDNIASARQYKEPLKAAELESLRKAFLAASPTLCTDCDGRCSVAGGTKAALGDLTRYLTYYERHGARSEARAHYAALAEAARDWKDADLEAAREACHSKLDFASLLPRIDRDLA
jgi:predicted aldo/keto reductase-like oxidoreductase